MTLIVASAKRDCQFIVADRRITDISTGNIYDDKSYKILIYHNPYQNYVFAVAYTGLAAIGTEPMVDWLMEFLPKVFNRSTFIPDAITNFNNEIEKIFRSITSLKSNYKAITFVLTGIYNPHKFNLSVKEYIPFLAIISNSIDLNSRQIQAVSEKFSPFSARILKPKSSLTVCRGDLNAAQYNIKELRQMYRYIRRNVPLRSRVRLAANFIKNVSAYTNTVGSDVLGVAIIGPENYLGFDFPSDEKEEARTMPPIVSASGTMVKNFKVRPISNEEKALKTCGSDNYLEPQYLVLTNWTGSGKSTDARRPLIGDIYKVQRYSVVSSNTWWESEKDCPYLGLLVKCDAEENVVMQITEDPRFVILSKGEESNKEMPSEVWLSKLSRWFQNNGMDTQILNVKMQVWRAMSISEVIEDIKQLLENHKKH